MSIIPTILHAVGNMGSAVANSIQQSRTNRLNRRFAKKESELGWERDQQMWQMQNEYNTPANQMKRFADAGLNPALIYGKGTAGNSTTIPKYQVAKSEMKAPQLDLSGVSNAILQYQDLRLKGAQVSNVKAMTEEAKARTLVAKEQANKINSEATANDINNMYRSAEKGTSIYHTQLDSKLKETSEKALRLGMDKTREETKLLTERVKGQEISNKIKSISLKYAEVLKSTEAKKAGLDYDTLKKMQSGKLTQQDYDTFIKKAQAYLLSVDTSVAKSSKFAAILSSIMKAAAGGAKFIK